MQYKPDLDSIIPRMEAWWQGEILDRACIAVCAPNGKTKREVPRPTTIVERWTDPDYVFESQEASLETTYYAGEAIPVFRPGLGPDTFAACLGAPIEFREDTSWSRHVITDWAAPPSFQIDEESLAWKWYHDMYRMAASRAAGRYFVAPPDCHSGGDCLLAMRGGIPLCMDLYDFPEAIHAAMGQLEAAVVRFHDTFFSLVETTGQRGHTSYWLRVWSPGRSQMMQLDLLALIAPKHFEEFFYHELEVNAEVLDSAIFHLDGPDAIKHLPILYRLLEQTRAKADGRKKFGVVSLQWQPGAGNFPMSNWIPLLQEMQRNGANIYVDCDPSEVEQMLTELSSKGLFLSTGAANKQEADHLVKLAGKLTHE